MPEATLVSAARQHRDACTALTGLHIFSGCVNRERCPRSTALLYRADDGLESFQHSRRRRRTERKQTMSAALLLVCVVSAPPRHLSPTLLEIVLKTHLDERGDVRTGRRRPRTKHPHPLIVAGSDSVCGCPCKYPGHTRLQTNPAESRLRRCWRQSPQ
jgi:hypothetical protein